ncbi:uncharacterized protein LOC141648234 isoform X2 [Silene latifolia]
MNDHIIQTCAASEPLTQNPDTRSSTEMNPSLQTLHKVQLGISTYGQLLGVRPVNGRCNEENSTNKNLFTSSFCAKNKHTKMAASSVSKVSYHARTISLPSAVHPVVEQLAEKLCRLRSSQSASTSSSSLTNQLNGLKDLYSCVDVFLFLQLPQNQQQKCVEETLDNSLRLLEICATSRDILTNSKEHLQDLQSVLRRRCNGELNITNEATKYLNNRKTAKKTIRKCLQSIKPSEINDDVFTGVEQITFDIFKSLLSYLGGAEMKSTRSRWSVVAKLAHHRDEKVPSCSKFEALDDTLSVICQKKKNNIEDLKTQMVDLEFDIQELDDILEALFRHFVKTRASLLNILSN